MSVQFGRWNWEDRPPAPDYIEKVSAALAPYGPDSSETYSNCGVKILYRAFHTTKESRRETQPYISSSGAVITWDGRLDNCAELIGALRDSLTMSSTDVAIVAAAYEKWGTDCFARLIGDWTISIWNPRHRSLILANDPIGTHHLYYSIEKDQVTWSTILDPLVRFAGKTFAICEEYIAGWFSILFPAMHLTPYVDIHCVPPSSSVTIREGKHTVNKYWAFDPEKNIRYRTDAEYEEHFRAVFAKAVQRKLRSDKPILAELSGGMDSSSIVCMADVVVARGAAATPRLDTVSWYDNSDPNWGERPYFTRVEEKRGRTGYHIDFASSKQGGEAGSHEEVNAQNSFLSEFENDRLATIPISNKSLSGPFMQYEAYIASQGYRVTLSGIGGEEATGGGVPTPMPELQNLLAQARLIAFAHQLNAWAIKMRKPRLPLLWDVVRGFFTRVPAGVPQVMYPTPWFAPGFARRNHTALCGYPTRVKLIGPSPSFQYNIHELNHARRFLAFRELHSDWLREVRYPYLDRDLLEFAYAIPREQLVRVGQRRSLMRRALVGIVPDELLNRRRRVAAPQKQKKEPSVEWPTMAEIGPHMISSSMGIMDANQLLTALQRARAKEEVPVGSLMLTLKLESWLRHLTFHRVLADSVPTGRRSYCLGLEANGFQAPTQPKNSAS